MYTPPKLELMNQKTVAWALGVSRHTVARLALTDPDFPKFWELSPGLKVIDRASFEQWLVRKRIKAFSTNAVQHAAPCDTASDAAPVS